jgi:DNA-binding MarR family transcriptional regulator
MTDADYRALSEFRYHIRRFLHFSEEASRAEGLEPQQHQILLAIRALRERQGPTIGELAEHLILRHHSAVGLVDRLERQGLVERVRDGDDRRQVRIQLTGEGAARLRRLSAVHREELRSSGPRLIKALRAAMEGAPALA